MATNRKIYVGNLPPDTTVRDVEKLFTCFGKITDIDVKNKNGPPFAFLTFEDKRDAEDAVHERDGYDLDGFSLRVEFPRDIKKNRREHTNYQRYENPPYVPQFDPFEMYMPYGYPAFTRHNRFNYYNGYRNNHMQMNHHPNNRFNNATRRPRPPRSTDYRVCISNLPPNSNWQDLKDFMRRYGEVSYADVFSNGSGVVDFVAKEDFRYVLKYVNNVKFKSETGHSAYIKVEEDQSRKKGYQRRSSKSHRSRSRSASRSKSVSTRSTRSKTSCRSTSSTKSINKKKSDSKEN